MAAPANRLALDLTRAELGLPALKRQFPHLEVPMALAAGKRDVVKLLHKHHDIVVHP